jgi:hypothetical protein
MTILWEFDENILNKLALVGNGPGLLSAVPTGLNWDPVILMHNTNAGPLRSEGSAVLLPTLRTISKCFVDLPSGLP